MENQNQNLVVQLQLPERKTEPKPRKVGPFVESLVVGLLGILVTLVIFADSGQPITFRLVLLVVTMAVLNYLTSKLRA